MKCLAVMQPWAYAITVLGKRCENRDWNKPGCRGLLAQAQALVGERVLLHTSARTGTHAEFTDSVNAVRNIVSHPFGQGGNLMAPIAVVVSGLVPHYAPAPTLPQGAIVGRMRLAAVVRTLAGGHRVLAGKTAMDRGACLLCGESSLVEQTMGTCPKMDPWANPGAIGLILADVERIAAPIPYKGALGFFEVPNELLDGATWTAVPP